MICNKQADHILWYFSNFNTVKPYRLWIQGGDEWERQGALSKSMIPKHWQQKKELLYWPVNIKINYGKSVVIHQVSLIPFMARVYMVPLTYIQHIRTYHCNRVYSSSRSLNIQEKSFWEAPLVKELLHTRGTLPHSAGLWVFISDRILW